MKIYFAGSIRAGREDQEIYYQLIQGLQVHGPVLTEHVGDPDLTELGDDGPSDRMIYQRDMPSETDQYFPPVDSEIEARQMPNAELRIIPSIWGQLAGGPGRNSADTQFIDRNLKKLLTS